MPNNLFFLMKKRGLTSKEIEYNKYGVKPVDWEAIITNPRRDSRLELVRQEFGL